MTTWSWALDGQVRVRSWAGRLLGVVRRLLEDRRHAAALAGVLGLTAFLHFYQLGQEGYGNLYYAAAVKSMLTSWHNFFFVSFDPGGFVSVDKPPLGLWVQTASAWAFGFHGWALLLPQALAGVASVGLLYYLVRRAFGPGAGLIAALVLATTPITVAADRNNTMDSQLVLTSLLGAWAALLAAETGRLRWIMLCAVLVGIGFNIKMLQATMVVPAFVAVYLVAAPVWWGRKLGHLALATAVLVGVSLSWAVAVDLTPAEARPYVGSSTDNSVMELITGHNGARRLGQIGEWLGIDGGGGARRPPDRPAVAIPGDGPDGPTGPAAQGRPSAAPPGDGLGAETGEPGITRLFNDSLAGQASWLLPLAGAGLVAAAWREGRRWPLSRRQQSLLLWGAWLLPQAVFFSYAGLFHRYYLEMMAPAIAALVGAGVVAMWKDFRAGGWRGWALPGALALAAATEVYILSDFPEWGRRLAPAVALAGLAAATLAALHVARRVQGWLPVAAATVGLASLLVAPLVWAAIPVWQGGDAGLPYAGPQDFRRYSQESAGGDALTAYLLGNRNGAEYLVATLDARTAAPLILETGEPVMALGGFNGGDEILSPEQLAAMVEQGDVRFFLLPGISQSGPGQPPQPVGRQGDLIGWVNGNCAPVPVAQWLDGQPASTPNVGPGGPMQLFDCAATRYGSRAPAG